MVGGIERYYQIAKCFRDEDLRADRQPEFTQIDMEMSFVEQQDVINVVEGLLVDAFKAAGVEIKPPFIQMPWQEAMDRYGSDKPDTRFGLELFDIGDIILQSEFQIVKNTLENGVVSEFRAVLSIQEKISMILQNLPFHSVQKLLQISSTTKMVLQNHLY